MKEANYFSEYFENISKGLKSIDLVQLSKAGKLIWDTHSSGKKIILVGNGGSAAMASHVAVDLTKAAGIRAVNFNEADLITCFANDYGYEHWVEKALEAYADQGDLAILISSSGKSANMVNGAETARKIGMTVITLSGFLSDNPLRKLGNVNLWFSSSEYNIVEMTHHVWLLAIIDFLIETKNLNK